MVVNFDLPLDKNGQPDSVAYLHRVGRTGSFGHSEKQIGLSVNFVYDKLGLCQVTEISRDFGTCLKRVSTNGIGVEIMINNIFKNKKEVEISVGEAFVGINCNVY
ncbi:hypothetical protein HOY82DRAFT_597527 [Tuber indicum]|nr:hypothetical protein HOY82DRAFT_597527 [Tuber indicum]